MATGGFAEALEKLAKPENSFAAGAVALGVSAAVTLLLWPLLGIPARVVGGLIPAGDCIGLSPGTSAMYVCSVKVGLLTVAGPMIVVLAALFFRRPIQALVQRLTADLPTGGGQFVAPLLSTVIFTMAYSGIHENTAGGSGIVPQRFFPAVVGLFTFVAMRFGPRIINRFPAFFAFRDRIPTFLRIGLALVLPALTSFVITNQDRVSSPELKEQVVILLALVLGWIAVVPRSGNLASVLSRLPGARA